MLVEFKPRVKCERAIMIAADSLSIGNRVEFESERYLIPSLRTAKSVCCSVLSIKGKEISISYLNKQLINPFNILIESSTPYVTSDEILSHDSRC